MGEREATHIRSYIAMYVCGRQASRSDLVVHAWTFDFVVKDITT